MTAADRGEARPNFASLPSLMRSVRPVFATEGCTSESDYPTGREPICKVLRRVDLGSISLGFDASSSGVSTRRTLRGALRRWRGGYLALSPDVSCSIKTCRLGPWIRTTRGTVHVSTKTKTNFRSSLHAPSGIRFENGIGPAPRGRNPWRLRHPAHHGVGTYGLAGA